MRTSCKRKDLNTTEKLHNSLRGEKNKEQSPESGGHGVFQAYAPRWLLVDINVILPFFFFLLDLDEEEGPDS